MEKWHDAVFLAWIGLAVYFSLDFFPNSHGRPMLDTNADGTTTITDFWLLIKNVSYSATVFPIVYTLSVFKITIPNTYHFFELDEISGTSLLFIGLIMWLIIKLCVAVIEEQVDRQIDNWSKRRAAKQLDAVRSGKRDRFP